MSTVSVHTPVLIPSREKLLEMYRLMLLARRFDESVIDLYASGEIPGFMHLYIGEEAVAVGACAALEREDWITSTHRGHGHCIAKGGDPKYMMAEFFAKSDGYCKGKGGLMHIANLFFRHDQMLFASVSSLIFSPIKQFYRLAAGSPLLSTARIIAFQLFGRTTIGTRWCWKEASPTTGSSCSSPSTTGRNSLKPSVAPC